ncbi:hypothetical protein RPHASCH2410_CH15655 [Rhizobium phaseoli Ch24-10]|nr:hypothetical protein RPHASCH2410_CH15655 [Rhizobium phaseoli Ch24-10]
MVGLTPTGVTGEGKPHEKPSHELAALGASFRRLRSTHGDFRQGRRREREFRFRDLYSHHRHPAGGGNDDLCDRQLAGAIFGVGQDLALPCALRPCHRRLLDLLFPGFEARRRRACGADRQTIRRLRSRLCGAFPRRTPDAAELARHRDDCGRRGAHRLQGLKHR